MPLVRTLMSRLSTACLLAAWLPLVVGCVDVNELDKTAEQEETPAAPSDSGKKPAGPTIEKIASDKLPRMETTIGPLDEGHLEAPVPEGWHVPPRDSRYLFRVAREEGVAYPSIILSAGPTQPAPPDELTADNVLDFAKSLQASLQGGDGKGPRVQAMELGGTYAVAYEKPASAGGQSLERLFLVVARNGRSYTVEMRALLGTLPTFRAQAYGVAARLKIQ